MVSLAVTLSPAIVLSTGTYRCVYVSATELSSLKLSSEHFKGFMVPKQNWMRWLLLSVLSVCGCLCWEGVTAASLLHSLVEVNLIMVGSGML